MADGKDKASKRSGPLTDLRLVELGQLIAGPFCGQLMADMGADVIKVEPPESSRSRRMGPFLEDGPEPGRSLRYFAFNGNTRGVTLDLQSSVGRDTLARLVGKEEVAEVVIAGALI